MHGSRKVLRLLGDDAAPFLQSLVTNDLDGLKNGLVYTALLTPQGKYMADFFLKSDGANILIDLPNELAETVMARLRMYILRKPLRIEDTTLFVSRGTGPAPTGALNDPRHPALGWRLYGDANLQDDTNWDALRIEYMIPEFGAELNPDSYILEHGFERLHGVDFKKGCYVGQEVTARMKHKTELRKGLARLQLDAEVPAGTSITANGKELGHITTAQGNAALAYVRFDRIDSNMQAGQARVTDVMRDGVTP